MLNLDYVYHFQKSRISELWRKPLPIKAGLSVSRHSNVYLLPVRPGESREFGIGGAVDGQLKYIPESAMRRGEYVMMGGEYQFDPASAEFIDDELIYLGYLHNHWGHLLVDCCARLWHASQNPAMRAVFITTAGFDREYHKNIKRFLELAGVQPDRILFVNKPVKIGSVIFPDQAYSPGSYYSQEFIDMISRVVRNITPGIDESRDKIYFSRSHLRKHNEFGREVIDELFNLAGYTTLYPEELTIDDQIYYLNNCGSLAVTSGSLTHNVIFARKGTNVTIVNKSYLINELEYDSLKIANCLPAFCDFYLSRQPVNMCEGPFLNLYNDLMRKYIVDNKLNADVSSYLNYRYSLKLIARIDSSYKLSDSQLDYRKWYNDDVHASIYYSPEIPETYISSYLAWSLGSIDWKKYVSRIADFMKGFDAMEAKLRGAVSEFAVESCLSYETHLAWLGWQPPSSNGSISGKEEEKYDVQCIKITNSCPEFDICYQVLIEGETRWTEAASSGQEAGTTGQGRKLTGLRIWLDSNVGNYTVQYSVYSGGWSEWKKNGEELLEPGGFSAMRIELKTNYEIEGGEVNESNPNIQVPPCHRVPGFFFAYNKLHEYGVKTDTDKAVHGYLRKYEYFMRDLRHEEFNLLELGIYKGASLKMWEMYFGKAHIYECDSNPDCSTLQTPRITVLTLDLNELSTYVRLSERTYRIIIDDASHFLDHQINSLIYLFPYLESGGIYIIEDLHTNFPPLYDEFNHCSDITAVNFLHGISDCIVSDNNCDVSNYNYRNLIKLLSKDIDMVSFIHKSCIIIKK